ncbi:MAG: glutathione S-transferase family protein [Polyangiales bacterium]
MPIILHQPPGRPFGMANLSPFCAKLELYLRMKGLPHEVCPASPRGAPKGKIPYVKLEDGTLMGDSQLIIERLEREHSPSMDAHLDDRQRAIGRVARRTLEEATYFIGMWHRWDRDQGWAVIRPVFEALLPPPARLFLPLIRRQVRGVLRGQGTGRHSLEELTAMGLADWDAIVTLIGEGPFLFGEKPTTFDATVFAFADAFLSVPASSPLRDALLAKPALIAYRDRVKARWFPELVAATS